jgi:hypothetical protein
MSQSCDLKHIVNLRQAISALNLWTFGTQSSWIVRWPTISALNLRPKQSFDTRSRIYGTRSADVWDLPAPVLLSRETPKVLSAPILWSFAARSQAQWVAA